MLYYFLDIDNNFTREKSYILSFIAKLSPVFSADELTALQIIPDSSAVNTVEGLEDVIAETKNKITECILKEHERKGSYEKVSRVNIIVDMINSNAKMLAELFVRFITDKFTKGSAEKLFKKSGLLIPLPITQILLKKQQNEMKKIHGELIHEKIPELTNDFCKRIIFYFFYISIIGNSYNESEKNVVWDLSNRWNIDTSAISDMDESAERMFEILAKKKSIITDKTIPYK
jgi:hypothetical protein